MNCIIMQPAHTSKTVCESAKFPYFTPTTSSCKIIYNYSVVRPANLTQFIKQISIKRKLTQITRHKRKAQRKPHVGLRYKPATNGSE